jgi:hypothetical protein
MPATSGNFSFYQYGLYDVGSMQEIVSTNYLATQALVANYYYTEKWSTPIDFNITYYEMYTEEFSPASQSASVAVVLTVSYMLLRISFSRMLAIKNEANENEIVQLVKVFGFSKKVEIVSQFLIAGSWFLF